MGRNVGTFLLAFSVASAAADGDYPSPLRRRVREKLQLDPGPVPDLPLRPPRDPNGFAFCDVSLWVSCVTTVGGTYAPCSSVFSLRPTFDGCEVDLQVLVSVKNLGEEKVRVVGITTRLDDEAEVLVSNPSQRPAVIPAGGRIIRTKTITANVCDGGNRALTTVVFGSYLGDGRCSDVNRMVWKQ